MNKKKIQVFEFEGKRITFDFGDGNKMVNATEMVKPFKDKGKRLNNFMRSKQVKEFIEILDKQLNPVDSKVSQRKLAVNVVQGGNPELQGTWMEKRLALKLAAWLEPRFELWIFDRIEELLTTGQTMLNTDDKILVSKKELEFYLNKVFDNSLENNRIAQSLIDRAKNIESED